MQNTFKPRREHEQVKQLWMEFPCWMLMLMGMVMAMMNLSSPSTKSKSCLLKSTK
jgi:hypothetical protein